MRRFNRSPASKGPINPPKPPEPEELSPRRSSMSGLRPPGVHRISGPPVSRQSYSAISDESGRGSGRIRGATRGGRRSEWCSSGGTVVRASDHEGMNDVAKGHQGIDQRSLALHRAIRDKLPRDPSFIQVARANLKRLRRFRGVTHVCFQKWLRSSVAERDNPVVTTERCSARSPPRFSVTVGLLA